MNPICLYRSHRMRNSLILGLLMSTAMLGCKARTSASTDKSAIRKTPTGFDVIYDLNECMAFKYDAIAKKKADAAAAGNSGNAKLLATGEPDGESESPFDPPAKDTTTPPAGTTPTTPVTPSTPTGPVTPPPAHLQAKPDDATYTQLIDEVLTHASADMKLQLKDVTDLPPGTLTNFDAYLHKIDFTPVMQNTAKYMNEASAKIYYTSGFKKAALWPSAFVIGGWAPIMSKLLPLGLLQQRLAGRLGKSVKIVPMLGLVIIPQCKRSVTSDGVTDYQWSTTQVGIIGSGVFKIPSEVIANAIANFGAPQQDYTSPTPGDGGIGDDGSFGSPFDAATGAPLPPINTGMPPATGPGPNSSVVASEWRLTLGFIWGPVLNPAQLSGFQLGLGGHTASSFSKLYAALKSKFSKGGTAAVTDPANAAVAQATGAADPNSLPKTPMKGGFRGLGWTVEARALWGSTDANQAGLVNYPGMLEKFAAASKGDLAQLAPTHYMANINLMGTPNLIDYLYVYGGAQYVTGNLAGGILKRQTVVLTSDTPTATP